MARDCKLDKVKSAQQVSERIGFFEAARTAGSLEVLNDIGASKISEGLRSLAVVSEFVRTGDNKNVNPNDQNIVTRIVGTAVDAIEDGADAVLDATGIGRSAYDSVVGINPQSANLALGQAKSVFRLVKAGNFSIKNIPDVLQEFNNLEVLSRQIFNPTEPRKFESQLCPVKNYAVDLIRLAPKFKHLFVVQIEYSTEYQQWSGYGVGTSFVVKESTRPNTEIEHHEVNKYNFRTQIPKRVINQPMRIRVHDDNENNAGFFHTSYMRAMSPQSNLEFQQNTNTGEFLDESGMDFDTIKSSTFRPQDPQTYHNSASLGSLLNNNKSIISKIRLFHIYDYGNLATVYNFMNPKIVQFELSGLDMADPEGSDMEFEFNYDTIHIEPNYDLSDKSKYNIAHLTGYGLNNIDPVFVDSDRTAAADTPTSQQQSNTPISKVAGFVKKTVNIAQTVGNEIEKFRTFPSFRNTK